MWVGVASEATIKENLLANRLSDPEISKAGIVKEKQLTRKSRELIREFTPVSGRSLAQALVSEDAGSGASIFTRVSCPQRLHFRGKFRTTVSGRVIKSFPFPHTGQITHPSFTTSLPRSRAPCNGFHLRVSIVPLDFKIECARVRTRARATD